MNRIGLLILVMSPVMCAAQSIDYNKVIYPEGLKVSFEERLVQLAWANHPTNKISTINVEMFKKEKSLAAWSWLDNFTATFNANQFTLDPSSDVLNRSAFYPKYNFSLRFSIGTLALTPIQTKVANDQILIANQHVNELKLLVRRDVLSNIEILRERYKVLRLRDRFKEDFLILYKDAEKKFSNGEIKIDQYQLASQAYYTRVESVITAQSEFNQTKLVIEAIIGVKLNEVDGYSAFLGVLESEIQSN